MAPAPSPDVRSGDPETSQHAARIVRSEERLALLCAFGALGGLTDQELARKTGWNEGTASKRRFRAQEAGLVQEWMGSVGCLTRATDTGAPARVHRLTAAGVQLLGLWEQVR